MENRSPPSPPQFYSRSMQTWFLFTLLINVDCGLNWISCFTPSVHEKSILPRSTCQKGRATAGQVREMAAPRPPPLPRSPPSWGPGHNALLPPVRNTISHPPAKHSYRQLQRLSGGHRGTEPFLLKALPELTTCAKSEEHRKKREESS